MTHETEIEFKNLLLKEEYLRLCTFFNVTPQQAMTLANHYFDTAQLHIKALHSGLRVRETDGVFEATLKQAVDAQTSLETNIPLTAEQASIILDGGAFPNAISEQLAAKKVPLEKINPFGSLTTKRIEVDYKGGTIVLDHSCYLQQQDYELEFETTDIQQGAVIFQALLEQLAIPQRDTKKKIARFAEALAKQKG